MKIFDRKTQKKKNEQGFTLVELAIVMLIAGILITPLIGLYSNYLTEQKEKPQKRQLKQQEARFSHIMPVMAPTLVQQTSRKELWMRITEWTLWHG